MNKSLDINRHTFLHVKQRLDYYYLPSDFPIQATNLIHKLLKIIDEQNVEKNANHEYNTKQQLKKINLNQNTTLNEQSTSSFCPIINQALRLQLSKQVKQNNQLNNIIMSLKQQISVLKHTHTKTKINNFKDKSQQIDVISSFNKERQMQLFQQLEQIKYKYNELMDFIHNQQPKVEKQFLKRLLKYKNYSIPANLQQQKPIVQPKTQQISRIKNKRGVTVDQTNYESRFSSDMRKNDLMEIQLLQQKVQNRQKQISRLQKKLQFDGINMNRILKQFKQNKEKQNLSNSQDKIKYLEKQNKAMKNEINKIKKQGGDKQALREHVQKLKTQNQDLKTKLDLLKRKNKQDTYEIKKQTSKTKRKLNQTTDKMQSLLQQKVSEQSKNNDLSNHLRVLTNNISDLQHKVQSQRREKQRLIEEISKLNKEVQNLKLMNQYETHKLAQRQAQLINKLNQAQRQRENHKAMNSTLSKQNEIMREEIKTLQLVHQQLLKKNSVLMQSTNILQKTALQAQASSIYKQHISQLKNKLQFDEDQIDKKQRQIRSMNMMIESFRKQCQLLRQQNKILNKITVQSNFNQQSMNELRKQKQILKQASQMQKDRNIQLQTKNQELQFTLQRTRTELDLLKEQHHKLQIKQKELGRRLDLQISELCETLNIREAKLQQKQIRINNLQSQLIDSTQRLRQSNRELTKLDDELHNLKMDKNRLDRKHSQLMTQYTILKQKDRNSSHVRQIQLKNDVQKLNRESQHNRMLQEQLTTKMNQLIDLKSVLQSQICQLQKSNEEMLLEIKNYKQRQQLYQMEIRQLKKLANYSEA